MIAGSDSSSATLQTILYRLLTNTRSLRRLQDELRQTEKTIGLTLPFPRWNEVKDLPYLDACVQEALRLDPPFTLPLEREVPQGGLTIGGKYFPEGTQVGMNPFIINRHRPTFGEDAEYWRPERWLVDKEEHRRKLEGSVLTVSSWKESTFSHAHPKITVWRWQTNLYGKIHRLAQNQEAYPSASP